MVIEPEDAAAFAQLGVVIPAEQVSAPPPFEVWRSHEAAFRLFLDLQTSWQASVGVSGLVWHGLDWVAAEAMMRMRQVAPGDVLDDLMTLEREALPLLNARD